MDKHGFAKRAEELHQLAEELGKDLDGLKDLPENDPIAKIGFLAGKLGVDFGLAFDTEVALKERV